MVLDQPALTNLYILPIENTFDYSKRTQIAPFSHIIHSFILSIIKAQVHPTAPVACGRTTIAYVGKRAAFLCGTQRTRVVAGIYHLSEVPFIEG